jgi:hypothetical protein
MEDLILNKKQQKTFDYISGLLNNPDVISNIKIDKNELIIDFYYSQSNETYERFIEIRKIKNLKMISQFKKTFPEYFI